MAFGRIKAFLFGKWDFAFVNYSETPQREKTSEDLVHYVTGILRVSSGGTREPTAKLTRPKSWRRSLAV